MLSIAIILFREVLEIALVLGVLLAATRGLVGRGKWVGGGMTGGIVGALVVAYFAEAISNAAQGMGQELFNAILLLLATLLIGWTVVWMRRHGRTLTQHFKEVGQAVTKGERPLYTLAIVSALAVLREGSEIVLFTYGLLASGEKVAQLMIGSLAGLMVGISAGVALYYGLLKISPRRLFSVTSWMLIFLAAGMSSQAAGFLASAGLVPSLVTSIWDSSHILSEASLLGKILHALVGYTERPSGIQLLSYLLTLGGITMILKRYGTISPNSNDNVANTKKVIVGFLLIASVGLGFPKEALATQKVYSPIVQKGELELEARGSYDFDHRASKKGKQKQKYAVGYGVTDRWFTELYGEIEKAGKDKDFEFELLDWENIVQLFEQGKYWLDAGLYFEYEFAVRGDTADEIEGKLLLEKSLTQFTHTLNLIMSREVGKHSDDEVVGGVAWSSRYRWHECFQPGFELHSDFGGLGQGTSFKQQEHQLGTLFYGKLGKSVKYDIGYLFGVSDAAPDGS